MTWQRIDENTYIDDSLVTCAEYQLFVDEMREQGKHYQPDHWTSYQFPAGQAPEPILGVRHSDATAFCKWLTGRETSKWKYGLPTKKEAENFPNIIFTRTPIGYWIKNFDELHRFTWIGSVPANVRNLSINKSEVLGKYYKVISDPGFNNKMSALTAFINQLRLNPLDLDIVRDFVNADLLARTLDRNLDNRHIEYFSRRYSLAQLFSIAIDDVLSTSLNPIQRDYERFVDIYTLRERIAGRSPAFEGIRLVKERIR